MGMNALQQRKVYTMGDQTIGLFVGVMLLVVGTITLLLTRRANRRRVELMRSISPNNEHPGVIKYAEGSRFAFILLCFVLGVASILLGIFG